MKSQGRKRDGALEGLRVSHLVSITSSSRYQAPEGGLEHSQEDAPNTETLGIGLFFFFFFFAQVSGQVCPAEHQHTKNPQFMSV